jgi:hypothetical protein
MKGYLHMQVCILHTKGLPFDNRTDSQALGPLPDMLELVKTTCFSPHAKSAAFLPNLNFSDVVSLPHGK